VKFLVRPRDDRGRIVPLSIPEDLDEVQRIVVEHEIRLVVIDPIAPYWSESVRTHNDASVRKAMTPLKTVAESTGAAIVIVRHLNKSGEAKAIYRGRLDRNHRGCAIDAAGRPASGQRRRARAGPDQEQPSAAVGRVGLPC
jgi:hypothetical protein